MIVLAVDGSDQSNIGSAVLIVRSIEYFNRE